MAARFLGTSLVIGARFDILSMVEALEQAGLFLYGAPRVRGGVWTATLDLTMVRPKPSRATEMLLKAVEGLSGAEKDAWSRCFRRQFDFGFECETAERWSEVEIEADLLRRIVALDGTIKMTFYSPSEDAEEPDC